jgi:ClpP class serine protease
MKFANIIHKLYAEPWAITPTMHRAMGEILRAHMDGTAHLPGGVARYKEPQWDNDKQDSPPSDVPGNIAIIGVQGVISQRISQMEKDCGGRDLIDLRGELEAALVNPGIAGVLLHFDTPGGSVTGTPEMAEYIENYGKPIVAFADGLCASAGYWLASQCKSIFATPSAQVGCIGVYQAFLDESRAYEMEGFKVELFKTGKFKGMGTA